MNTRNALLVVAGLMLAWAGVASADMTMTWAGERQGVAKAAVAGDATPTEATDVLATEEDEDEESSITREEYLATVAYVEGEAAVDELSRRMVEDMFGPSDDGEGSQYGDSTLPGGGDDGALPGGVKLTRSGAVKAGTGATWTGEAKDESKNYGKGEDWFGKTGGEGFGIWTRTTDESLLANHTIADNGGFRLQAGSDDGETIVMRDLNTDVGLTEGTFNVRSWGTADEPGDFAGYAIYGNVDGSSKELFRWGVSPVFVEGWDDPVPGYVYSTEGNQNYHLISDGYSTSDQTDYCLTWGLLEGTGLWGVVLTAEDGSGGTLFTSDPVELGTTGRVMAIAVVLVESGTFAEYGDGTDMQFDNLKVKGTESGPTPAVPEPGTLGLLAAGLAALWRRKAKREK